jgi:cytochrome c556
MANPRQPPIAHGQCYLHDIIYKNREAAIGKITDDIGGMRAAFNSQNESLKTAIDNLTEVITKLVQTSAVNDVTRAQLRTEVDEVWKDVREIKDALNEFKLVREKITHDFKLDQERIAKDLNNIFVNMRNAEAANAELAKRINELFLAKEEMMSTVHTFKWIAGILPVVFSALGYLIMKLFHAAIP